MGYAYFDTEAAKKFLQQAVEEPSTALPLQGVALYHWYQYAKDKKAAKAFAQSLYPSILDRHRQLYEKYDIEEEGLPYTPEKNLQDPFFLSLLVWSNENLIQIGHVLQEDVLDIIQWNELTIYSMNEKLWDTEQRTYLAYDRKTEDFVLPDFTQIFAPMLGEIPTQEQAEEMFIDIQRAYLRAERMNVWELWLLRKGLLRYDFKELAVHIRQRILQAVKAHGFYENFDVKSGKPIQIANGPAALTAILTVDLLKKC